MKFDFMSKIDKAESLHKASILVEALPYIRQHTGKIIVIKYGGHAMGDNQLSLNFSKDVGLLKELGMKPIVVHGGGPQIGQMLKEKNIKSQFIEGLRVTNSEVVKIVEDVLFNQINNKIVTDINLTGGKAIGLAGNKDKLIEAKKINVATKNSDSNIEKILDLGFVGTPTKINLNIIKKYLEKDYIPVIAPLGTDGINTFNINADTVAGEIAGQIKSSKLILLTDVPGIMDNNKKLISEINLNEAKEMINQDFITGGMKPKILTCIKALENGVKEATVLDGHILHSIILELFTIVGVGTQIRG